VLVRPIVLAFVDQHLAGQREAILASDVCATGVIASFGRKQANRAIFWWQQAFSDRLATELG
jgi:hypothetical protein